MSRVIAPFAQFFDGDGDPLANGWLTFYETNTNNTYKNTYADVDQTVANANPLQLDGEGRCPNCFGQGLYRVVLSEDNPVTHIPGTMIQIFDPVVADYVPQTSGVNFGDWSATETYQVGNIVLFNSIYYRSIVANNLNYPPDSNGDKWEQIDWLRIWNIDITYALDDLILYDGGLYFSLSAGNIGNQPDTSPTYWSKIGEGAPNFTWAADVVYSEGDVAIYVGGQWYRSIQNSNVNQQPDITPTYWEAINFISTWNINVTYALNDIAYYQGAFYISLQNGNVGQGPTITTGWWRVITYKYWGESSTEFIPLAPGYHLGNVTNPVGFAYINALGVFPVTPNADPAADLEVANKRYVDNLNADDMHWQGAWVPGTTYSVNEVVTDDNWTMIANTTTTDRPAPQPAGESNYISDDIGTLDFEKTSTSDAVLYVGQRYDLVPAFLINAVRAYIPYEAAGFNLEVWIIYNPGDADQQINNLIPGFTIDEKQTERWIELKTGRLLVAEGITCDIIMVLRPSSGTSFTHEWIYTNEAGDPGAGEIYHQTGTSLDEIRVHEQDSGLVDRTTELNNIGPGSTIYIASQAYTWEVISASKTGDIYTFTVMPGAAADAVTTNFTFTYYSATAIEYVYDTDYYSGDSRISGFFGDEYLPNDVTKINNNAYGMDIQVQNVITSGDWDVVSYPQVLGGGSAYDSSITGSFKNKIINGNFDIWQRGTSFSATGYTADRWGAQSSTSINRTTVNDFGATYGISWGNTAAAYPLIYQRIESINMKHLAGKQITVSFYARSLSSDSSFLVDLLVPDAADDYSTFTLPLTSFLVWDNGNAVTDWVKYSYTWTLTSAFIRGVALRFFRTNYAANAFTEITQVQFEEGSGATPFEFRPIGIELDLCRRYFEKSYNIAVAPGAISFPGSFYCRQTLTIAGLEQTPEYQTRKRTTPTIAIYSPSTGAVANVRNYSLGTEVAVTSVNDAAETSFSSLTFGSSVTNGEAIAYQWTADAEI